MLQLDLNGGTNYSGFSSGEFILAWEDLKFPGADGDYSDFVVMVESVEVVPEPSSVALMALGLFGLAAARRKKNS